jgi:hypothetical protein
MMGRKLGSLRKNKREGHQAKRFCLCDDRWRKNAGTIYRPCYKCSRSPKGICTQADKRNQPITISTTHGPWSTHVVGQSIRHRDQAFACTMWRTVWKVMLAGRKTSIIRCSFSFFCYLFSFQRVMGMFFFLLPFFLLLLTSHLLFIYFFFLLIPSACTILFNFSLPSFLF